VVNPERYTGYKGPHAHKIWNSIYRENCFSGDEVRRFYGPEIDTCLEKRVFYRLISGLHASINIHLCASYLFKGVSMDRWGPNVDEFKRRFDPSTTNDQGPEWLKNLYFIYLVELRAITKAAPYFEQEVFYTGQSSQSDEDTKTAILSLLNVTKAFNNHFDETILFKGDPLEAKKLKVSLLVGFY
jgi:ERO1-like protein alpha